MKMSNFTLLSCLILASFLIHSSMAQNASDPVVDTTGQPLRQGIDYLILPATGGTGGGLTEQIGKNNSCPYEIVQTQNKSSNGFPLTFSPVTADSLIRVGIDLNIKFFDHQSIPVCPESNVWRINNTGSKPVFITIGGIEGNPGPDTLPNWFNIQKYEDGYQLQYCPNPSQLCAKKIHCNIGTLILCEYVGVFEENGRRRLALNQPTPFKVVFKRAF